MPEGIIISSGSTGTKPEDLSKFLESKGYEVDKPEAPAEEPQREAFGSDEDFNAAHETWETAQEPEKKEELAAQPKKSRVQRRVDEATRKLQEELAEARKRLEALEGKQPPEPEKKAEENLRPNRADFQSDDEYADALLAWGINKHELEKAAKDAQTEERELLTGFIENYNERKEEFAAEHEDFEDVIRSSKAVIHSAVQMAIYEMENGPDVVYHLASHPEEAEKLAELTPLSAVMEVGRLSVRLKTGAGSPANDGAKSKPRPQLPVPIRPVSTAATSTTLTSREAAARGDFSAFKKARGAGR